MEFKCRICGSEFDTSNQLRGHMGGAHKGVGKITALTVAPKRKYVRKEVQVTSDSIPADDDLNFCPRCALHLEPYKHAARIAAKLRTL
jgi:hypothetical protein